jgi:TRAP-type C4-dicarboxylate transport system substrate-binding protein
MFPFAVRALAVAGVLGAATLGAQAQTVNIKMSSWVPAQHALNPGLQAWGESLKRASGGTINPTLFPAEQLGKAFDHYDMARDGITDFAYVNPGYQPGRFPIMAGASLPFLFANGKSGSAAIDDWYRRYAATEMKDVKFCFAFVHDPGTFHSRKKITSPSDIRGMKIRPATSTIGQMVTSLGGTNVQASAPEARDMLERGVADAITFPWGSISLFGIDKVVTFHMDVPLYVTPFVWVMNKGKYDGLNAVQKKAVDDHCTSEWAEKVAGPWADQEFAGRSKLATQAWAESVRKVGQDPKAVMDSLKASLVKYKAAL